MYTEMQLNLPGIEPVSKEKSETIEENKAISHDPYISDPQIDLHFSNFIARNTPPRIYPGI